MKELGRYSLHVGDDGAEVRFDGGPDSGPRPTTRNGLLVHDVRVLELDDGTLIDETTILTYKFYDGPVYRIVSPPAHGRGWTIYNNDSDNRTVWRRPHVPMENVR